MIDYSIGFKEFISQALVDIIQGVSAAKSDLGDVSHNETNAIIAPHTKSLEHDLRNVEFDLSVTYAKNNESSGGFSILIAPFGGGAARKDGSQNSASSNIKFSVPMNMGRISKEASKYSQ